MNKDSNAAKTKLAAIVGGAGGVGSATAKLFKEQGYRVAILDHKNCNVADEASVSSAFKKIETEEGAIDIIVYVPSAPITPKPIFHKRWDDFSKHIDVQAKGLFFVFSALSKSIISGHKIKFIILSTEYCIGTPPVMFSDYITAKYALLGLSKCLAVELARFNSTLNIISPGPINTKLLTNPPSDLKVSEPEDIAKVILFLAGNDSKFLNGANINVNGGNTMF